MNQTGIIWTEATWNPMSGCQKVSAGCKHCYAFTLAEQKRGSRAFPHGFDLTIRPHKLIEPSKLKDPTLIFVNSMSDLFYEKVPDEYRNQIMDVIENHPQHEFQVLTKRPELMLEYSKERKFPPNFWAGVSVENEFTKSRIQILNQVDSEIRFVSMEPLLGDLNLKDNDLESVHWVITGGESGKHLLQEHICEDRALVRFNHSANQWEVREDRISWIRDIKDFCVSQGIKYFHKQWGGEFPSSAGRELDGRTWEEFPRLPGSKIHIENKHLKQIKMEELKDDSSKDDEKMEKGDMQFEHPEETAKRKPNPQGGVSSELQFENLNKGALVVPFSQMSEVVKDLPEQTFIWGNIPDGGSLGIILGATGSGKSILSENLAMALLSGADNFLGLPINFKGDTVLSINLEEGSKPKTQRQILQSKRITDKIGESWKDRLFVITDSVPQYLTSDKDFEMIKDLIRQTKANIVFIDSITHLYDGSLEESSVAKKLMKKLRGLAKETNTVIIPIHHTPKIYDYQLTNNSAAGSRVITQELDFMLGINEASNGKKYIKMLKSRYCAVSKNALCVSISNDCWLELECIMTEQELIMSCDGRFDSSKKDEILTFIDERCKNNEDVIDISEIKSNFDVSEVTIHSHLNKLIKEKKIIRITQGKYRSLPAA